MSKEENFKVCGLCSKLVDESVQLDKSLRTFLVDLLKLGDYELPNKVCTECYQGSCDSKRFQEACLKAIRRLSNTNLSDSMILGKSAEDKRQIVQAAEQGVTDEGRPARSNGALKGAAPSRRHAEKVAGKSSKPRSTTDSSRKAAKGTPRPWVIDVETDDAWRVRSKRSRTSASPYPTRHRPQAFPVLSATKWGSTTPSPKKTKRTGKKMPRSLPSNIRHVPARSLPVVQVSEVEKMLADKARSQGGRISYRKRKSLLTPSSVESFPAASERQGRETSATSASPFHIRGSRSTRKRGSRGFSGVQDNHNQLGVHTRVPRSGKKSSLRGCNAEQQDSGSPSKVDYYLTGDPVTADAAGINCDTTFELDDEREIFPSIGPYQCEICQDIKETKKEFVMHIKRYHKQIVDEDVLRALESDMRKKQRAATSRTAPSSFTPTSKPKGAQKKARQQRPSNVRVKSQIETQKTEREKRRAQSAKTRARNAARRQQRKQLSDTSSVLGHTKGRPVPKTCSSEKENRSVSSTQDVRLDGEVEEEEEVTQSHHQHWKNNVARKFKQEPQEVPSGEENTQGVPYLVSTNEDDWVSTTTVEGEPTEADAFPVDVQHSIEVVKAQDSDDPPSQKQSSIAQNDSDSSTLPHAQDEADGDQVSTSLLQPEQTMYVSDQEAGGFAHC